MKTKILVVSLLFFSAMYAFEAKAVPVRLDAGGGSNINRHNFSINRQNRGGETLLKANDGTDLNSTRICVFCHAPHSAKPESTLWNRNDPIGGPFPLYGRPGDVLIISDPVVNSLSQYGVGEYPNGATKLCLSCHDGVSAVGEMWNGVSIQMSYATMNAWQSSGGDAKKIFTATGSGGTTAFDRTHPVSFIYDTNVQNTINSDPSPDKFGKYNYPTDRTMLDSLERVQCTTCHDPHYDTNDGTYTLPFWRVYSGNETNDYDAVCAQCHTYSGGVIDTIQNPGIGGTHGL